MTNNDFQVTMAILVGILFAGGTVLFLAVFSYKMWKLDNGDVMKIPKSTAEAGTDVRDSIKA